MTRDACAVCGRARIEHVIATTIDHAFVAPLVRKGIRGRKARATTCPRHGVAAGVPCPGGDCQERRNEATARTRRENIAARVAAGKASK